MFVIIIAMVNDSDDVRRLGLLFAEREDDCDGALSLWNRMQEDDVTPSQRFVRNLSSMCTANNRQIPPELAALLDKHSRKATGS